MKDNLKSFSIIFVVCMYLTSSIAAQITSSTSSDVKRSEAEYQVKLQLLIASNIVTAKTDYPPFLETIVKQLKSSLPFKSHRLYATYLFNVAENGCLKVTDVTYAPYESSEGGSLDATFLELEVSGIKLNADGKSVHISKFKFGERKRIFIGSEPGSDNQTKSITNTVGTGIETELNFRENVPKMVGTTTSALSDGVLVIILTVTRAEP